jgi:peptidoglycan/xylan/chitin deacetylase (PgdA/CDA1 family)
MRKGNRSFLKTFGPPGMEVMETVAREPSLSAYRPDAASKLDIFCLRIDADEYTPSSFEKYYPLFRKYGKAISIFFSVNSFKNAPGEIERCRETGIETASHGFYHYTYSDQASNLYNIRKADEFFRGMGIRPRGFVAPTGRWTPALSMALEEAGYSYSSEFSYDYMGYPHYPVWGKEHSKVLQIPVFPVAPELFWQGGGRADTAAVKEYYHSAIDVMTEYEIPVIIYAHTAPGMPQIPDLLDGICEYALERKKLRPVSMEGIYDSWHDKVPVPFSSKRTFDLRGAPGEPFVGSDARINAGKRIKRYVKTRIDYETVTPAAELKCGKVRKMVKLLARRLFERYQCREDTPETAGENKKGGR